jgi:hypothetical protein
MAKIAPYTNLDFTDVKDNLIAHLTNQDEFVGYDFTGSNMNVLVDIMAYNAYNNMQYYNMTLGETFLDSAVLKNSIISHAKELNYLPRSKRSSGSLLNVVITSSQPGNTFVIPRAASFLGRCGNISYNFLTTKAHVATRIGNTNTFGIDNMAVFEGRNITEVLKHDNTLLSNSSIDTRSVRVFVNGDEYTYKSGIFGVGQDDKVFYLQPELNDTYSVQFGQTLFGYQPTATDVIEVSYRVSSGAQANGVKSFTINAGAIGASSVAVTPVGLSVGGADAESVESVKQFAPKAFQVQDRAVTASDYEVLLKTQFPEIENISVFGGDEATPPQFGRVIVVVDVQGRDGAADTELALYKDYIKSKSPLTIEPIFQEADFIYGNSTIEVTYSRNTSLSTPAALEALVRDALTTYNDNNLNTFASTLSLSDLSYELSLSDDSIMSISAHVKPMIDYKPALSTIESPIFNFNTQLLKPYPFNATNGLTDYKPAVTSTRFTIDTTTVELQDDGNGVVQAIVANDPLRSVYKKSVGSVDYNTGQIILKDFIVASFEGNAIQISVTPANRDFTAPKDRIFRIRQADTSVSTRAV